MIPYRLVSYRLLLAMAGFLIGSANAWGQSAPAMKAHFIDVGQGDATLLEFPCGAILIDVGSQDAAAADRLSAYLDDFFPRAQTSTAPSRPSSSRIPTLITITRWIASPRIFQCAVTSTTA